MRNHSKNLIPFIVISCLYILIVFVFALQYDRPLEHLCLVKNITGIPCPGCGLTRSYLALLNGHLILAFFYHPLFFTIPFILLIILFLNCDFKPTFTKYFDCFLYGMILLFCLTYIIRMILYFPTLPPMNFNPEGLIPKIIDLIS